MKLQLTCGPPPVTLAQGAVTGMRLPWGAGHHVAFRKRFDHICGFTVCAGLEQLRTIRDPAKERAVLHDMEEVFRGEAPWLFLYFQPDFYASSNRVKFTLRHDELIDVMSIQPAH